MQISIVTALVSFIPYLCMHLALFLHPVRTILSRSWTCLKVNISTSSTWTDSGPTTHLRWSTQHILTLTKVRDYNIICSKLLSSHSHTLTRNDSSAPSDQSAGDDQQHHPGEENRFWGVRCSHGGLAEMLGYVRYVYTFIFLYIK